MTGEEAPPIVTITVSDGEKLDIPILSAERTMAGARATVVKDAGDDPDITDGVSVVVNLSWVGGNDIIFAAGEGVGVVTKPGLSIPPGQPAVNPIPRRMITGAIRSLTNRGVSVTVSVPGGEALAAKTFNPRLGIIGGLSILGTTGRVRPFSCSAVRESIRCAMDVAVANGIAAPIFVPGHIGTRSAMRLFNLGKEKIVEVSNEWGFAIDEAGQRPFRHILVMGHPGKLAKLAQDDWDTHSSRSKSALPFVGSLYMELAEGPPPEMSTVEGIFGSLPDARKRFLGDRLAGAIKKAVMEKIAGSPSISVMLVDMNGNILGSKGDLTLWE
jgi:cobalt-precorrin-5B (C1)-methyltransferase